MTNRIVLPLILLAAVPAVFAAEQAASPARTRLAYVSLQQVAARSDLGRESGKKLEALRAARSRAIAETEKKINALRLQIAQSGGIFSASKRADLQKQEEQQRAELQHLREQAQADVQKLQQELQTAMRQELNRVMDRLSAERGVDLVVNSDTAVVWSKPGLDLTNDVVTRFNAAR